MYKKIFIVIIFSVLSITLFSQVDRTTAPLPGTPKTINIGDAKHFELKNGLKVYVIENHKLPTVTLSLIINRDPILETNSAGFLSATGSLLRAGTKYRTKILLDEEIDFIGASINTTSSSMYAYSLKKHFDKLMDLTSDIILNSDFKQDELDKIKTRQKSGVAAGKEQPASIANVIRKKLYYGKAHPYSESETESTIDNITLESCRNYYSTYYRPNISYLAIVGDITVEEAKKAIEKYLGKWEKKDVPKHSYPKPTTSLVTKVSVVDRPNSVQSTVRVGHVIDLPHNDPMYMPAYVMNTMLGGGWFRLFLNLREKHGYTYGAYSSLAADPLVGHFTASADVRNEVTDSAIAEILFEMKRIKNEPVSAAELDLVKNYLTGNFSLSLENPQTIANFAINIDRFNLPKNFYKDYLKNIAKVTAEDIQKAASKFIQPEKAHIMVVGKASEVAAKLARFTIGKVDYFSTEGEKIDPNMKKAPEGVTGEVILDKYLKAIGGKDALLKINDRSISMTANFQGMSIQVDVMQKSPNKYLQATSVMGQETKMIFDGEKGYQKSAMGESGIEGVELEILKAEANMYFLTDIKKEGASVKLIGLEKLGGNDAYKIELHLASGGVITQYFDVESSLKVKETKFISAPQGLVTVATEYSDYRDVEGMKYPFVVKQSFGPMNIELKVTSISLNKGLSDELFK